MGDGAASKEHGQLDLVSTIEKPGRLAALGLQVMSANFRFYANLFELGYMLISTRITLFTALFISKFSVIHQSTDRWCRIWSDFHEVKAPLACHIQSFPCRNDADLAAFVVD